MDGARLTDNNNFSRNVNDCFLDFENLFIFLLFPSSLRVFLDSSRNNASRSSVYMWMIELSFPFTLPFISPRAINPFLLLTRASITTCLIYFRSRSPMFFLSPPFDVATLNCSVNSASGEHPLSFTCTRLLLPLDWWIAFKSTDFTRFTCYSWDDQCRFMMIITGLIWVFYKQNDFDMLFCTTMCVIKYK